jgi:hypothetical protein
MDNLDTPATAAELGAVGELEAGLHAGWREEGRAKVQGLAASSTAMVDWFEKSVAQLETGQ